MSKERRLSGKQRAFIDHYLGKANYNATKAARMAGYKGNGNTLGVTGRDLLNNPKIKDEIAAHFQASAMTRDEVLQRMADIARGDYHKYIDEFGKVDLAGLKADGLGHLIKGITPLKNGNRVEFYDGQSALALIAKHQGLLSDKVDLKIETTLGELLNKLEERLDRETYQRVLSVIAEIS